MFAPTDADFTNGVKLYTGEPINSRAATGHILGEEACRALILLDVKDTAVKNALDLATQGMLQRLRLSETESEVVGRYCCGTCSAAYLGHVLVGGLDRNEARLMAGMKFLRSSRTGKGRWRFFPFYYTLLVLSEMDKTIAKDEIKYAAPALERGLAKIAPAEKYAERRHILSEHLLTRC